MSGWGFALVAVGEVHEGDLPARCIAVVVVGACTSYVFRQLSWYECSPARAVAVGSMTSDYYVPVSCINYHVDSLQPFHHESVPYVASALVPTSSQLERPSLGRYYRLFGPTARPPPLCLVCFCLPSRRRMSHGGFQRL